MMANVNSPGDLLHLGRPLVGESAEMEPPTGGSGRTAPWRRSRPAPEDAATLAEILQLFAWPYEAIMADPRGSVALPEIEHWRYLLCLFDADDVVWIGRDVYDTGGAGHRYRFRRSDDWLSEQVCPGRLICPNTFAYGEHSRTNKGVVSKRYLAVESDLLIREEVGAIFRWLESAYPEMRLRAVVDTGGKSLHGWFDYPSLDVCEELQDFLPRLKCDPAMFAPSQPCRLPGVLRPETKRWQKLIYFNPSAHSSAQTSETNES